MTKQIAWDLGPVETSEERADRETRLSDFFLFALLPLSAVTLPRVGVPVNEVAALLLTGLAVFRKPRPTPATPTWFVVGLLSLMALLVLSAQLNDGGGARRLVHMVGYLGIALALASGRVSMLSAARGLALSLAALVAYGIATLPTSLYPGRLTGVLADPNVAAYVLTTLGLVSVPHVQSRWLRRVLLLTIAIGVVLSFSRTGLLAMLFVLLWVLIGKRVRLSGGILLVAGLVYLVSHIPDDLRLLGPFANRTGSDELRARIIAQERVRIADMPWYGNGPGSAKVQVGDDTFFFHNSYLATLNEGGWLAVGLVVFLLAGSFVLLDRAVRLGSKEAVWMQCAVIAVLVVGTTLGEVLLDLPTAVVLGFAVSTALHRAPTPTPAGAG